MKLFVLMTMISGITSYFRGCPMDGCESTLSGFVDINVDRFNERVEWQRTDLLTESTRGCASNEQSSLLCVIDDGYGSINVTNGRLLWRVDSDPDEETTTESLPVINYQGYAIIANSTQCALIDPQGQIGGTFGYIPLLIPPLAGPFVTNGGQIIVADSISFVGIEDSGVPLGVQAFPPGYHRLSRSMSLNPNDDRWYLIAQQNTTFSQAIIAAETTGSIVGRIRIAWVYDYGLQSNSCNSTKGPLLSIDRKWLFVSNSTGIVIIADNDGTASVEHLVSLPRFCANDMAFSETDSTLIVVDKNTFNISVLNISTLNITTISLTTICEEEIIGQLSRITIIENQRLIVVVITATRKAVLLLIDYNQRRLLSRLHIGNVSETISGEPLTQLAYSQINDESSFVTIAHKAIGVLAVRLLTSSTNH